MAFKVCMTSAYIYIYIYIYIVKYISIKILQIMDGYLGKRIPGSYNTNLKMSL